MGIRKWNMWSEYGNWAEGWYRTADFSVVTGVKEDFLE